MGLYCGKRWRETSALLAASLPTHPFLRPTEGLEESVNSKALICFYPLWWVQERLGGFLPYAFQHSGPPAPRVTYSACKSHCQVPRALQ